MRFAVQEDYTSISIRPRQQTVRVVRSDVGDVAPYSGYGYFRGAPPKPEKRRPRLALADQALARPQLFAYKNSNDVYRQYACESVFAEGIEEDGELYLPGWLA